eukprot:5059267-Pleurochrysis_carterae.AAC.4
MLFCTSSRWASAASAGSLADGAWPVRGAPALFGADLLRAATRTLLNYEGEMAEEHSEERSGVEVAAEAVKAEAVKAEAVKAEA